MHFRGDLSNLLNNAITRIKYEVDKKKRKLTRASKASRAHEPSSSPSNVFSAEVARKSSLDEPKSSSRRSSSSTVSSLVKSRSSKKVEPKKTVFYLNSDEDDGYDSAFSSSNESLVSKNVEDLFKLLVKSEIGGDKTIKGPIGYRKS